MEVRASRTSSSLKGLITAMTIFMDSIPAWPVCYVHAVRAGSLSPDLRSALRRHSRMDRIKRRASCPACRYIIDFEYELATARPRPCGCMGLPIKDASPHEGAAQKLVRQMEVR